LAVTPASRNTKPLFSAISSNAPSTSSRQLSGAPVGVDLVAHPGLSGHPQISTEAFSGGSGIGSFVPSAFSGKDVHVARLRALVAAVLLLPLVACEDEPTPSIPDPTPSSSAPSPSDSASSPTTSPTAQPLSPEETVRAWVEAWNHALRSGDTADLENLGSPDCRNCSNYVKTIADVMAAGGEFSGGEWSIVELSAEEAAADEAKVVVGMAVAAGATINMAGEDPVVFEAERRGLVYRLARPGEGWHIVAIDLLS
jgi:hypothetical protein